MDLRFEWDEAKAAANLARHGISFDEAQTVFGDAATITRLDEQHADVEDRFVDIGMSGNSRILVVIYSPYAKEGFGEAKPPRRISFPHARRGVAPPRVGGKRFLEGVPPSKPPA